MASLPISLIVAYSLWYYFLWHQTSHVVYHRNYGVEPRVGEEFFVRFMGESRGGIAARRLSLFLQHRFPLTVGILRVLGIAFLIFFGYVSQWYFPLILYAIGLAGQFVLVRIETAFGLHRQAWAISLFGLPVMPAVLAYMFYIAIAFR